MEPNKLMTHTYNLMKKDLGIRLQHVQTSLRPSNIPISLFFFLMPLCITEVSHIFKQGLK